MANRHDTFFLLVQELNTVNTQAHGMVEPLGALLNVHEAPVLEESFG